MRNKFISKSHDCYDDDLMEVDDDIDMKDINYDIVKTVYNCIDSKDYAQLNQVLSSVGNINSIGIQDEYTPLAYAIDKGDFKAVQILIAKGADTNTLLYFNPSQKLNDSKLMEILEIPIEELNQTKIEYLKSGHDLDNPNSWNDPVLNFAIEKNNDSIANLLISNNANVENNDENIFIESPLVLASKQNNEKILKKLLETYEFGEFPSKSALFYAIENKNYKIVNTLLEYETGVYFSTEKGSSIISQAALCDEPKILNAILKSYISEVDEFKLQISFIEKSLRKAQKDILKEKNPKRAKERAKEISVDLFALKDILSKYIEFANSAICQAYQNKKPYSVIIDIMSARDLEDYSNINHLSQKELISNEIHSLKRQGYFRKAYNTTLALFKTLNFENIIDKEPINSETKYSPAQFLKKFTYSEDIKNDRNTLIKVFDKLDSANEIHIDALLTYNALMAMDKNNPMEIVAAKSSSGSVSHLNFVDFNTTPTMGLSISEQRKILFSPILQDFYATKVLLHEMTHNMMFQVNENLDVNDFKQLYSSLNKTIEEQKKYLKKPGINNQFTNQAKDIFDRIESNSEEYSFSHYYNEDVLCDILGYLYRTQNQENKKNLIESNIKPFLNFLDKELIPKVLKQIIEDPNVNRIKLPTTVRNALINLYPKECSEKNIIPQNLGRLFENQLQYNNKKVNDRQIA
jgi:hypothetical protein